MSKKKKEDKRRRKPKGLRWRHVNKTFDESSRKSQNRRIIQNKLKIAQGYGTSCHQTSPQIQKHEHPKQSFEGEKNQTECSLDVGSSWYGALSNYKAGGRYQGHQQQISTERKNYQKQWSIHVEQSWYGASSINQEGLQIQKQQQLQRSIEASKQMLYGVFGNVITMLEEYERRDLTQYNIQHIMPKSDINIPDQRHKTFEDVKSNVECQLLLFETQTKVCPPEALVEVQDELKRRTLAWSAVREEIGIQEIHQTDVYLAKLYEILAKGETFHSPVDTREVTEEAMREGFQAMLHGDHDRAELDKAFRSNPDKMATGPKTRRSQMTMEGATRISRAHGNSDLDLHLRHDVDKIERDGPEDIK